MKYKLIIFDWDGTLMDSEAKIVASIQAAAQRANLPIPSKEAARDIIGLSLGPAIKQLFSFDSQQQVDDLVTFYKSEFVSQKESISPLFAGVKHMLASLRSKNLLLAVATGKGRLGLNAAWHQTGTGHFFNTSRCADDAKSKPHPDMLEQILGELSIEPTDALMVGDTSYDMAMAEALNMDRLGVSFGVHSRTQLNLHRPIGIIDRIEQVHTYL
jgi:phosphoglycolate phosphatase